MDDHLGLLEASINRRFLALDDLVHAGVIAHQREHEQLATQSQRDEADVNRRLEQMNELRAQIASERNLYVTRALLDSQMDGVQRRAEDTAQRLDGVARLISNIEGRFWMFGITLTILSIAVNFALSYTHH